jgi:uncharacterized membrane protein
MYIGFCFRLILGNELAATAVITDGIAEGDV